MRKVEGWQKEEEDEGKGRYREWRVVEGRSRMRRMEKEGRRW